MLDEIKRFSGRTFIPVVVREKRKFHQRSLGDGTQKQGRIVETQSKLTRGKTTEWRKTNTHI